MYNNTRSRVRVNDTYSDEFGVKVGVHQGLVLSPLLFVIVLEALSCEFCTGTPWELLYADDLVISAETEEGLKMKLNKWKTEMEAKGLRVNMGKTKIMISGVNLRTLKDSGKYPGSVCRKGVGSNSIYCAGCSHWVHKKCSGVIGSLKSNPDYRCSRCKGTARPIDGIPHNEWLLMQDKNWMLPILTSLALSYITRGQIYSKYTARISALSCCMPVSVGPPMSMTCLNCNVMIEQ